MGRQLKLITFHATEKMIAAMKEATTLKLYPNRSEMIRVAIRDLLINDGLWKGEPMEEEEACSENFDVESVKP